jgi:hypothetical protein
MPNALYYGPVLLTLLAAAFRFPVLSRGGWKDPLLRTVALVLILGGTVFFFAAPDTIARVNSFTGVPNISAPITYGLMTSLSAAMVNLMIAWRGGEECQRRRAARWCLAIYGSVTVVLFILFALGDAPDERLRDFDTYYANTPFIREMVAVYLVAHTVAVITTARLCWRWFREVSGLLGTGLLLIATGAVLNLGYDVSKLAAVTARWLGHNLDPLSTSVAPPAAALSALFFGTGFLLPSIGRRVAGFTSSWRRHSRLAPLSRALRAVVPGPAVRVSWWASPGVRQLQRKSDIRDGMRALAPYIQRPEQDDAGLRGTGSRETCSMEPAAIAAIILDALDTYRAGRERPSHLTEPSVSPLWLDDPATLELVSTAVHHHTKSRQRIPKRVY